MLTKSRLKFAQFCEDYTILAVMVGEKETGSMTGLHPRKGLRARRHFCREVRTAQADGSMRPEPLMDVAKVAKAILYMASLPLDAKVATMTLMATNMPFIDRG